MLDNNYAPIASLIFHEWFTLMRAFHSRRRAEAALNKRTLSEMGSLPLPSLRGEVGTNTNALGAT